MANDVVFRRIHGRIIPIRKKHGASVDLPTVGKGAAHVAVGAATAIGAGSIAAGATKRASQFRVQSRIYSQKAAEVLSRIRRGPSRYDKIEKLGQLNFGFKFTPKTYDPFSKTATSHALKSQGFRSLRKGFRLGGLAASTAFISTGLKKLYEGTTGKKADTKTEVIATASGAGATFALSSAYAHRMLGGGRQNLVRAVKFGLRAAKVKIS
jgi:hypothetical protein